MPKRYKLLLAALAGAVAAVLVLYAAYLAGNAHNTAPFLYFRF